MKLRHLIILIVSIVICMPATAQKIFDMHLYQGKPGVKSSDKTDTARVRVYLPEAKLATGRAIVICLVAAMSISQ